jgi:hypothetical protein
MTIKSVHLIQTYPTPSVIAPKPDRARVAWLDEVYSLVDRGETERAVDELFEQLDDLLLAGDFESCDRALGCMDEARLDSYTLIAALSVTLMAAAKLPRRNEFVRRTRRRLAELDPVRADRLLEGLV